ncbi:hypothetical protein CEE45_02840 [Candidatus Heimdallarchaeota archaeon B3_Heim]|nr:MAG: hypothetical protein CEE45_02840 [Candidatus Heimdallarchaeota archaeon B3_Heim]
MKNCTKCGLENPDTGLFCMGCGEPFTQEKVRITSPSAPSPVYQPISPSSTPAYQPARGNFPQLIFHANYQRLLTGSLFFALGTVFSFSVGIFIPPEDSLSAQIASLISLVCFAIFIYSIYSFSQLEPRSLNDKLSRVPLFFGIYMLADFISSIFFSLQPQTIDLSLPEGREFLFQASGIILIEVVSGIFLFIGALKFTSWFRDLVLMLNAPDKDSTNRIKWFATCTLIGKGLLLIFYIILITASSTQLDSTAENAITFFSLAAFILLAASVLQVAGGYKVYSVLNNIRRGKYNSAYQQRIPSKD